MGGTSYIHTTLRVLKELDSIVDFSRSTNQLVMIFYLSSVSKPVSLYTISRELGVSRKVVLDSMRKLERKGLVVRETRDDDIYFMLSRKGRDYINKLFMLLKGESRDDVERKEVLSVATRLNLGHWLITAYRIYRALVALGLSGNEYMSLNKLAEHMGLSPERAKSYLDSFSTSPSRLFRRISIQNNKVYYRIEKDGYNILRKSPHYLSYKRNRIYMFFTKLFKTPWPSSILRNILLFQSLTLSIILISLNIALSDPVKSCIEIVVIMLWFLINIMLFIKLRHIP